MSDNENLKELEANFSKNKKTTNIINKFSQYFSLIVISILIISLVFSLVSLFRSDKNEFRDFKNRSTEEANEINKALGSIIEEKDPNENLIIYLLSVNL